MNDKETLLHRGIDIREFEETPLTPEDITLVADKMSISMVMEMGFHPDDQHRKDRVEYKWDKDMRDEGFITALENQPSS